MTPYYINFILIFGNAYVAFYKNLHSSLDTHESITTKSNIRFKKEALAYCLQFSVYSVIQFELYVVHIL